MRKNLSPQRRNNPIIGARSNSPHKASPQITKIPNRSDPLLNQGFSKKNPQIRKPKITNIPKSTTPIPKLVKPKKIASDHDISDDAPRTLLSTSKAIKNKVIIEPSHKSSKVPQIHKQVCIDLPSIDNEDFLKREINENSESDNDQIDSHDDNLFEKEDGVETLYLDDNDEIDSHFEDLLDTPVENLFEQNHLQFGTEEFHKDFLEHIEICNHLFTPQEVQTESEKFSKKLSSLTHLLSLIAEDVTAINKFTPEELELYIGMIKRNIFRPISYPEATNLFYDVYPAVFEPTWPHLDLIYLSLYRIHFCLPQSNHFDYTFIKSLYPLLGSGDSNERVELISFFKAYISRHPDLVDKIINDLSNIFLVHIDTQQKPFHVWTSLPIFLAICDIDNDPQKYHKLIQKSVVPLIKDKFSFYFNSFLSDVLNFYTEGYPENAKIVVKEILKYWPKTSTTKISTYTTYLAEILHHLDPEDLNDLIKPIFKLFATQVLAYSPKIAESALSIWAIPQLESVIDSHNDEILSIMVPSIMKALSEHWFDGVKDSAMLAMSSIMSKNDMSRIKELTIQAIHDNEEKLQDTYKQWTILTTVASENDPEIDASEEMRKIDQEFVQPKTNNQNDLNCESTEK